MRTYTALLKSDAEPVLLREGFSWGSAIFGPFWLAAHRAWIAAAISLSAVIVIATIAPLLLAGILLASLILILGLTGNDLRQWALQHRGYLLVHVLVANNWDEAFLKLLTHRPDLAKRFWPELA